MFALITAHAAENLVLTQVEVECEASDACSIRKSSLENMVGEYRSLVHLKNTLRLMALVEAGLSQREAHDWTGVSRDTIRKHQETRR